MTDIRQAKNDEQCYEINGEIYQANDEIKYKGKLYNAKEIYLLYLDCSTPL